MPKKPYIFISFDTEDAINTEADEALLSLARIYSRVGIPACFFMVGQKARMLRERGRKDVLDALKEHEIDYHGSYWFEYPEPALVYGNSDPWDAAVQKASAIETPGLNDVAEITGQFPVATCQHQNNHSPATTHAMQMAGVKVWNGGFGGQLDGLGWIMGMFMAGRHGRTVSGQGSWGGFQSDPEHPGRRPPAVDPKQELKTFQQRFDTQLERGHSHLNILGHPSCWALAEWWGWYEWSVPFRRDDGSQVPGPYPHGRQWEKAVARSPSDREAHLKWTAQAARWLAKRNDIRVARLEEALNDHTEPPGQWLSASQVRSVARQILKRFDHVKAAGTTLSAADALVVLSHFAEFMLRENRRPANIQIRRTLGPVEEILIPKIQVTFKRQSYLLAARHVVHYVNTHGRLPHAIWAHHIDAGPGEVLLALAQALKADKLPDTVTVEPTGGLPECYTMECFVNATANSSHAPPGYSPDQIHLQARQQSWSYRPAVCSS